MLRRGVLPPGVRTVLLDCNTDSLAESRDRRSGRRAAFRGGSFDVVTCLEVLEHLDDPARAVRELARVASGRSW